MRRFYSTAGAEPRATAALSAFLLGVVLISHGCASSRENVTYDIRAHIREVVEVPMVPVRGVPFVQAHVNGAGPFWFIVDTGAEMDVVHSRLAHELQLNRISAFLFNNTVEGDWCDGIDLRIGDARYRPERVASSDLDEMEEIFEQQIDGVLGQGFFRCFVVELDNPRQVLRLHPPRRFNHDGVAIPVTFDAFRPTIEADIELAPIAPVRGSFFVDTGSVAELKLGRHFLDAHGFEEWMPEGIPIQAIMLHGKYAAHSTHGVTLRVGTVPAQKPRVWLEGSSGLGFETSVDGTIGSGFLQRFRVIIDYPRERLWIGDSSQ